MAGDALTMQELEGSTSVPEWGWAAIGFAMSIITQIIFMSTAWGRHVQTQEEQNRRLANLEQRIENHLSQIALANLATAQALGSLDAAQQAMDKRLDFISGLVAKNAFGSEG
jgi:hypothetical protein